MKFKTTFSVLLSLSLLSGCVNSSTKESAESAKKKSSETSEKKEKQKVITKLNEVGEIKKGNNVKYTLEPTEVIDVTDEAKNKKINDSNYLEFYSSGQGKQAVKVTFKMTNSSGEKLGLAFLDNVKVKDIDGITNLGGWKNDSSANTEFGMYQMTDDGEKVRDDLYEIEDGETRLASSTVILATPSDRISFVFKSSNFNDSIQFDLPVSK
ncbi:hypothetical protein P7H75_05645 [Vagococcus carniphilus]|uniref:hypothetical protein n=1 Tax=Vagococcus carniphilus TaxID=218144 RepID=UPI00288FBB17|nr:hypothetical protein [Vagococcus carniphilus]MDT2814322.1 hypothetical protein [Vagococcus carniphilus]